MDREFLHPLLPKKIETISGYYELTQERLITYRGEHILYYLGCGIIDNSCCGTAGWGYALVIGFVKDYKALKNKEGLFISKIRKIVDQQKNEVEKILKQKYPLYQIVFL